MTVLIYTLVAVALGGWLTACTTVGPDYTPPKTAAPAEWKAAQGSVVRSQEMDPKTLATWWQTLNDPVLNTLIDQGVAQNLDLKQAQARLRQARAQRGVAAADRFPTLGTSGAVNYARSSANASSGATDTLYSSGFDASWEIDLFGGVQRSVEAAEADVQASQEDLRDVLVSTLAEVALNYVEVRSFQARLDVAQQNLKAQQQTYAFIQSRFQAGLVNELDVEQARTNLESTQAAVPSLETSLAQAKNRLSVLLGQTPGTVDTALVDVTPIPVTPIETAVGVPADVLRRRPDVRRAERQLAAETARIGVATAELYPKLSLSGSIGLESTSLASLFTGGSQVFGIGPSFQWNLFNAGRVRKEIAVQTAIQEEALLSYETAVLEALEEVENAITAYTNEQVRRQSLLKAAAAADRSVKLAQDRYRSGLTDFLIVLDAQRSLLTLQDQLTVSEGEITSNLIRLYKALGGGWTALEPQVTTGRS